MSPRNKIGNNILNIIRNFLIIICILVACLIVPYARADNTLIEFYRNHISAIDGDRCRMHPTCSAYAKEAIEKHGPIVGWIMTCDRLVRCGRDETRLSPKVIIGKTPYTNDPVESNDFWWFEKEKE